MLALTTALTATLHRHGILAGSQHVVAAWSGQLHEYAPWLDEVADEGPVSVLGLDAERVHLWSRGGVVSFDLAEVRGICSPKDDWLRFDVLGRDGASTRVQVSVPEPFAVLQHLRDAREFCAAVVRARREPPKRRPTIAV